MTLALLALKVTPPTAGGLTPADLIAILAVVVTVFGLLLTAIGVLMLRTLSRMDSRVTEVKNDLKADLGHVWRALDGIYQRLWAERVPAGGDYRDLPRDTPHP